MRHIFRALEGLKLFGGQFKGLILAFIKINYNEKTAKKKRRASWFSRYFGQSSGPSSGDLMEIRIFATICSKTVTAVDI